MSDFKVKLDLARQRLPLRRLMEQHGKGPENGNWKKFPHCPYCDAKDGVGLVEKSGREWFKCWHTNCSSNTSGSKQAWDEIGFLMYELKLDRKSASVTYLKEAGVWEEQERIAPSVMPGKRGRKRSIGDAMERIPTKEEDLASSPAPPTSAAPESGNEGLDRRLDPSEERGKESARKLPEGMTFHGTQPVADDSANASPASPAASEGPDDMIQSGPTRAAGEALDSRAEHAESNSGTAPEGNGEKAPAEGNVSEGRSVGVSGSEAISGTAPGGDGGDAPSAHGPEAGPAVPHFYSDDELIQMALATLKKEGRAPTVSLIQKRFCTDMLQGVRIRSRLTELGLVAKDGEAIDVAGAKSPNNIIELPPGGSGGGGGGDEKPPEDPDANAPAPIQALRWFYRRLQLSPEDQKQLWERRGLTKTTCDALGYRSNPKTNKALLEEMAEHFPVPVLIESGLYSEPRRPGEKAKPNPQFHGMSIVEKKDENGKKVKGPDGDVVREPVWNYPILIPYFDANGDLLHLRPHKGMMEGKPVQFYIARPNRDWLKAQRHERLKRGESEDASPRFAVITEGEFKAAALWQVVGGRTYTQEGILPAVAGVGSLPGITMAKLLLGDIEEWLESLSADDEHRLRQVVIGYDNEEKGDPKLPSYKHEKWKRFDSQIWARYLAQQLAKEGYQAGVCVLPKEWRDEKGKADWDGQLARRLDALCDVVTPPLPGVQDGSDLFWKLVAAKIRAEWAEVLKSAVAVKQIWQAGFFDSEDERIINNALARISYEARLPVGGEQEIAMARRMQRLLARLASNNERMPSDCRGQAYTIAKAYLETRGRYYILKPLTDKRVQIWYSVLAKATERNDVEVKRACEVAVQGTPTWVSDFYMKAHYVLSKLNGTRCRLVTLHNVHGVSTGLLALPSAPFAQPSKFREWLLDNITGATWRAGERELNDLQADIARDVAYKDVGEVAIRGYHADSRLWFFKDVTYDPNGREIFPDKNGIIWHDGRAYKPVERDHENQEFRQQEPKMRPDTKAGTWVNGEGDGGDRSEEGGVRRLFKAVSKKLYDTIGGYGGYLALGTILSYGAGPEIYEAFKGFPGLWLHGETKQGKTSVALWLMRVWGYDVDAGIGLKDSSRVGVSIAMQQYGNLPVFLEEFQPHADSWVEEKLKNIFDRISGSKKTFDEGTRRILTGAMVTGVATASDAQLKSRYAHVLVASANRRENHYDWFEAEKKNFYLLGRFVMRNRKEFSRMVVEKMREWLKSSEMTGIDARARIVHGAAYASFWAMVAMLESHEANDLLEYRKYLIAHCRSAVQEVHEQVNVNQFWHDVLDALKSDAFGETVTKRQLVLKVVENTRATSPLSAYQLQVGEEDTRLKWKSYLLYFNAGAVIGMVRQFKRMQGRDVPLDRHDLQAQMQSRSYWVKPLRDVHRQRFGTGRTAAACWCIDLDKHELGYRAVTDEEFKASLMKDGNPESGQFLALTDEWIDPRRGDLFELVDALARREESAK